MPLSPPTHRKTIHHRLINMQAFRRDDGLFDIEAHLVDTKPFAFARVSNPAPLPAGEPLHDLWVRVTVDGNFFIHGIEAASDATPYSLCKEAETTLQSLIGERMASGWSSRVKEKLRGAASCTHLMELLIPIATTAFQGIMGAERDGQKVVDVSKVAVRLDSCYAYARDRSVVKTYWPQHYRSKPE
ncbi:MAG: hypothetical protein CL858_24895 [Cupriavidus sp.]|nr:hypothetical protein [Cupriavidus sp.]